MIIFKDANVIFEDEILKKCVAVENDKIIKISDTIGETTAEVINAEELYLSPGLIDLHVHGGGGYSAMGSVDDILNMAKAHKKNGVTSILPTSLAEKLPKLNGVCENIRLAQKQNRNILGAHLEGPFLSPKMCGAQNTDVLAVPRDEDFKSFIDKNRDILKIMGVAPELPGALELGNYLKKNNIVCSLAHSSGNYDNAVKALHNGFSDITHIYNACTSCYKDGVFRKAGTVEAALSEDAFTVQAIADLKHLPVGILKLVYKAKGAKKMYLISDGLEFSAMDIQEGQSFIQKNGVKAVYKGGAMLVEDESCLAGSAASGISLVKNMVKSVGVDIPSAVRMMSLTPAEVIGADTFKGKIKAGYDADLILFDKDFNIRKLMCLSILN